MPRPATATRVPDSCQTTKPPDWDLVPFDVGCARCGQDLRGLSEPVCPACGLEFDWVQAVPIEQLTCGKCGYHLYGLQETRCPECGEPFTWQQVLDDYRRRRKPLFEYHWRTRPVRSFLATLWLSLRPWKLWRLIDIHDPPNGKGLALMITAASALAFLLPLALSFVGGYLLELLASYAWVTMGPTFSGSSFGASSPFSVAGLVTMWAVLCAGSIAGTLGTLLLLRQSMRLCRVRTIHVARSCSYGMLPILALISPGVTLFGIGVDAADVVAPTVQPWLARALTFQFFPFLMLWIWMALALGYAYVRYIRMKHAIWVVLVSQVIALMTAVLPPVITNALRLG